MSQQTQLLLKWFLTEELCTGLVWVQRLDALHVLHYHIQPQLGALFAVEWRGDTLLYLTT